MFSDHGTRQKYLKWWGLVFHRTRREQESRIDVGVANVAAFHAAAISLHEERASTGTDPDQLTGGEYVGFEE